MGKANVSRQELVKAIATFEAQRGLTGNEEDLDRAVGTVLLVLREKLERIQAESGNRQRQQLAVLVADLSGYTTLSEHMDAEQVGEALNSMWRVLDAVIRAWGGQIDLHAGDSLMAMFGLPQPRQGDIARALHAALAMQQELKLFNERVQHSIGGAYSMPWADSWPGPDMRIGVHSGIVYYAHVSSGGTPIRGRASAVGETVDLARRLEKLAPAGGVLASAAAGRQAHEQFSLQPFTAPLAISEEESAFLVNSERRETMAFQPDAIAGQSIRLVGRADQLDRLNLSLQAALDSRAPQLVTIVGPSGIGKSRLVHEFIGLARLAAGSPLVLRAGTQGVHRGHPFALIRDLLLRQFNLHPQDSPYLIEHKILVGLNRISEVPADTGHRAPDNHSLKVIMRLLDAREAKALPVEDVLAVIKSLMRSLAATNPVIVILEGINRADAQSLELIARLVTDPELGPIMMVGVATETAAAEPTVALPWPGLDDDGFSPFLRIDLPPLTAVESRLMTTQILSPLSPMPMRLVDLVATGSGGNPLYIECFVRLLMERDLITVGNRWRCDMAGVEATPLPLGISGLFEARISRLPAIEQVVLQRAAVSGPLCWDSALLEAETAIGTSGADIEAALLSLEMKRYLIRDDSYSFGATQAYAFQRDTIRETVYRSVPESRRRELHLEAAHWLITNENGTRPGGWLPFDTMIAQHFALAGDTERGKAHQRRSSLAEFDPQMPI